MLKNHVVIESASCSASCKVSYRILSHRISTWMACETAALSKHRTSRTAAPCVFRCGKSARCGICAQACVTFLTRSTLWPKSQSYLTKTCFTQSNSVRKDMRDSDRAISLIYYGRMTTFRHVVLIYRVSVCLTVVSCYTEPIGTMENRSVHPEVRYRRDSVTG